MYNSLSIDSSLITLRNSLALCLAEAACRLFPGTEILQIEGTEICFFADFLFSSPFVLSFLPLLDEEMRRLLRSEFSVEHREMMGVSAAGLLQQREQNRQAIATFEDARALIKIAIAPKAVVVHDGPFCCLSNVAFALMEVVEIGHLPQGVVTRIIGIGSSHSKDCAYRSKKKETFTKRSRLSIDRGLEFWSASPCGGYDWCPFGDKVRRRLETVWAAWMEKRGFACIATVHTCEEELSAAHGRLCCANGSSSVRFAELGRYWDNEEGLEKNLLTASRGYIDRQTVFCADTEVVRECISFLQFVEQISRILPFEVRLRACISGNKRDVRLLKQAAEAAGVTSLEESSSRDAVPRLEYRIRDCLGRYWPGPALWLEGARDSSGMRLVAGSVFGRWERWLALLLEATQGDLPSWLIPEYVRVFAIGSDCVEYVRDLTKQMGGQRVSFTVNVVPDTLRARVREALQAKVPYLVFVGPKEKRDGTAVLRKSADGLELVLTREGLVERMQREFQQQEVML